MTYKSFLNSPTKNKWQKIGIKRRSGIAVPLFSINSRSSTGIGEFSDLKFLIDWCKKCGFSILQILPLFDTDQNFAPYSSISSFALDLIYLNINDLIGADLSNFKKDIKIIKETYPNNNKRVDYDVKNAKTNLLLKIFKTTNLTDNKDLQKFINENKYWLTDYALFKLLAEINKSNQWEHWDKNEKNHDTGFLKSIESKYKELFDFHIWIQWQIYEQLKEIKNYAHKNNVFLMGDIPILVSRSSADVWAHQNYFKLELTAGAPPDMFFAYGQKWGSPPHNWKNIENDRFIYLKEKIKYAEHFFAMYRIDHFIGLFRIWTFENKTTPEIGNIDGKFDPEDKNTWEQHGKKIINAMLKASSMLPCAEDLGTVPKCSYTTLKEFSIPGIDFQRFKKTNYDFINTKKYRNNSISIMSTHDLSFFINWWEFEAGCINNTNFNLICKINSIKRKKIKIIKKKLFKKNKSKYDRLYWKEKISQQDIQMLFKSEHDAKRQIIKLYLNTYKEKEKFLKFIGVKIHKKISKVDLIFKCLKKINGASSIFSIQLLQDYLCLDSKLLKKINKINYRINVPGTSNKKNWSIKLPISLEKLKDLKINKTIRKLNRKSGRLIN